jgi:hypothetical protein
MQLPMLKTIIIRGLAPLRWAFRFELERRRNMDSQDIALALQREALAETVAYAKQHLMDVNSVDSYLELLSFALTQVKNKDGLYLESGVFSGCTVNHIAGQIDRTVYGFDSFEGLPERWRDGIDAGQFKPRGGVLPKVRPNVELVKGWFDKTLPSFLGRYPENVSFIHVDCDLYSSTKTIFTCLGPRVQPGTVIVFDEYFNYFGWKEGEFKAFQEFISSEHLKYEYLSYNRTSQQVCVRITERCV